MHPSVKRFYKQVSFNTPCIQNSFFAKFFRCNQTRDQRESWKLQPSNSAAGRRRSRKYWVGGKSYADQPANWSTYHSPFIFARLNLDRTPWIQRPEWPRPWTVNQILSKPRTVIHPQPTQVPAPLATRVYLFVFFFESRRLPETKFRPKFRRNSLIPNGKGLQIQKTKFR